LTPELSYETACIHSVDLALGDDDLRLRDLDSLLARKHRPRSEMVQRDQYPILAAFSDEDGQVIVKDIFIELWDLDTETLITPTNYKLSINKRSYPGESMVELPDSLKILKPGQHRIAYKASIPVKTIDRISNLEVRFCVKTLVRGQQFIIDRKIQFHRIDQPLMLISV